ncbi:MAG TPA: hypothetical protein VKU88_08835 [Acidimicrobiales bacterium]|nr:hypothetical protein [Acidimicrobiales bacterium]
MARTSGAKKAAGTARIPGPAAPGDGTRLPPPTAPLASAPSSPAVRWQAAALRPRGGVAAASAGWAQSAGQAWAALLEWGQRVQSSPPAVRRVRQVAVAILVVAVMGFLIDGVKRVPHPYIVPTIHPPHAGTPAGTGTTTPGGATPAGGGTSAGAAAIPLSGRSSSGAGLDAYQ